MRNRLAMSLFWLACKVGGTQWTIDILFGVNPELHEVAQSMVTEETGRGT